MVLRNHRKNVKRVRKAPVNGLTEYGTKRFRTSAFKKEFVYPNGTLPKAVIVDIDGTLQGWGATTQKEVAAWVKKHDDAGTVILVVTARDHDWDYERSFHWLLGNLHHPFVGPILRAKDDPRLASEFKRGVAEAFHGVLYTIVGAADDNTYVNTMWKWWGEQHPEVEFDLLEAGYQDYGKWRKDLVAERSPYRSAGYYGSAYDRNRSTFISNEGKSYTSRFDPVTPVPNDFWDSYDRDQAEGQDVQGALAAMDDADARSELEDEIYAHYPDLGWQQIEKMDTEVLRQMMLDVGPDTEPLDVAEIYEELGEQPFTKDGEVA